MAKFTRVCVGRNGFRTGSIRSYRPKAARQDFGQPDPGDKLGRFGYQVRFEAGQYLPSNPTSNMNKNDEKMLGGISRQLNEAALSVQKQADKMSLNVKSTLAEIAQRLSELTDREAKEKAHRTEELMYQYFQEKNRYRKLLERVLKGENVADQIRAALTITF